MLTVAAMVIGFVGGIVVAVMRLSPNPVLRGLSWLFMWFFRGTPLLVQIIFWGFIAALYQQDRDRHPVHRGRRSSRSTPTPCSRPIVAALLALGLNEVAYAAEIVRGRHPVGRPRADRGRRTRSA